MKNSLNTSCTSSLTTACIFGLDRAYWLTHSALVLHIDPDLELTVPAR